VYLPGDTVLITDIGQYVGVPPDVVDPGTSLVCRTELVNTECCRGSDNPNGGSVGEWFGPDGNQLPRFNSDPTADFSRSGYAQEVRLNRRNNAMSPTGVFECRVPPMGGGALVVASITITSGKCNVRDPGPPTKRSFKKTFQEVSPNSMFRDFIT
jgi:hypothetical protein